MSRYRVVIRALFAVVFIGGGAVHLVAGRLWPQSYGAFGSTAALPWLHGLWGSFVMPNIAWLTIALAVFEIACGIGILIRRASIPAAWGMAGFLVFVTVLGYGFPTDALGEDLVKNRLATIVLASLLVPVLAGGPGPGHQVDEAA
jgi:uncharacterized membrane protein YphA (DoxX/SURF4 family)